MANTKGEKELRTSYDDVTENDTDKAYGVLKMQLEAEEGSLIARRKKGGLY